MPDIDKLFVEHVEKKGLMHVAQKLGHDSTSIVKRWIRDGKVPEGKKFQVLQMLQEDKVI